MPTLQSLQEVRVHWRARFVAGGVPLALADRLFEQARTWDDWGPVWGRAAEEEEARGAELEAQGCRVSAGEAYFLAALLYNIGQLVLFHDVPRKDRLARRREQVFRRAAPWLLPPAETFQVGELYAYLRLPSGAAGRRLPCVLVVPGADSVKEENLGFTEGLLRRGLATVCFDGPGQGETRQRLPFEPEYERRVLPLFGHLARDPRLDPDRIAICGLSFGGYLAPRVAAASGNRRGCVVVGGCHDLHHWDRLPELLKDDFTYLFAQPDHAAAKRFAAQNVDLTPVLPGLRCPLLVVHGKRDGIFPWDHAERIAGEAGAGATLDLYDDGDHCVHNLAWRARATIGDWLAERLSE